MKKSYLFGMFALAAMTMVGCSNDEVVENFSQDNAIEFGTYVGRDAQSRGEILTTEGLKEQGFGVYAYYTGQSTWAEYSKNEGIKANFMNNTKVTYDENLQAWTYSPIKYWPNNVNDKVSFFAYAPYNKDYKMGETAFEYEVPNDVKEHIDLTWTNSNNIDKTKQGINEKVVFKFQHALAKIGLTYQAATDELASKNNALDENTTIVINRVILSKGDVEYSEADKSYKADGVFYTKGTMGLDNAEDAADWSNESGEQYFTLTTDNFANNFLNTENSLTPTKLNKDDSFLMIIPQNFSQTGFNVFIEYVVTTKGRNEAGEEDCSVITNRINTEDLVKLNFESGKQYTLKLILGMTSVKVAAEVVDWENGDEEPVDLPKNEE